MRVLHNPIFLRRPGLAEVDGLLKFGRRPKPSSPKMISQDVEIRIQSNESRRLAEWQSLALLQDDMKE